MVLDSPAGNFQGNFSYFACENRVFKPFWDKNLNKILFILVLHNFAIYNYSKSWIMKNSTVGWKTVSANPIKLWWKSPFYYYYMHRIDEPNVTELRMKKESKHLYLTVRKPPQTNLTYQYVNHLRLLTIYYYCQILR